MSSFLAVLFPNWIEGSTVILGLINIVLIIRRSVWNYPFGIAMVSLTGIVVFEAKLYSDALLQVFFVIVNFYGWVMWQRSVERSGEVVVETMAARARWLWLAACLVATAIWGAIMHRFTDAAYPWWDASVAMFSIAAQILMSQRKLENWVLWIGVNVVSIGLYYTKGLMPFAILYVVFLILASWGLIGWHRVRRAEGPVVA
jgi:nicotinamide mononucleotide transporter